MVSYSWMYILIRSIYNIHEPKEVGHRRTQTQKLDCNWILMNSFSDPVMPTSGTRSRGSTQPPLSPLARGISHRLGVEGELPPFFAIWPRGTRNAVLGWNIPRDDEEDLEPIAQKVNAIHGDFIFETSQIVSLKNAMINFGVRNKIIGLHNGSSCYS